MRKTIQLSEFRHFNEAERAAALRDLALSARGLPNGELTMLDARIRAFEAQYEMKSEEMRERLASGQMRETAEIASWLIALDVQGRLRATD